MTAILAARVGGRIIVGADRAWSSADHMYTCGPKVLRAGAWLVALAGEACCDWEALAEHNPRTPDDVGDLLGRSEADVLLVRGKTIRLGSCDGSKPWAWGAIRGDAAIGDGGSWLHGAWDALEGYELDAETRMRRALKCAARRCPSVKGPFDVVWV